MNKLVLLLLAASIVSACGHEARTSTNDDPMSGYFEMTKGNLGIDLLEEIDLLQEIDVPETQEAWDDLVLRYRNRGLADLAPSDRAALLTGATKAFLATTRDLRWRVEASTTGGPRFGTVTDQFGENEDGLGFTFVAEQAELDGFNFEWGYVRANGGSRFKVDLITQEPNLFPMELWTSDDGTSWVCTTDNFDTGLFRLIYLALFAAIPRGEVVDGPSSEGLVLSSSAPDGGRVRYQLDPETLWIKELEQVPVWQGELSSRWTLLGRNSGVQIARPGDPTECSLE